MPPKTPKSAALREAQKRAERRRDDVVAAARAVTAARRMKVDVRRLLGDLDLAVDDLEAASQAVADATAGSKPADLPVSPGPVDALAEEPAT